MSTALLHPTALRGKSPRAERPTQALRAELVGSTCTAAGVTATAAAPALALCRQLLAAGLDPDGALEVYRGATLALRIRSIGEGAALEVNSKSTDFVPFRDRSAVRTASPMRQTDYPLCPVLEAAE